MNILSSILIAILTIFALKRHNKPQNLGLGNRRFLIAIICASFPYLDRVFCLFDISTQMTYQNTFLWSFLLIPMYALGFTALFKHIFGEKIDIKYLYPAVFSAMMLVALFNLFGNQGLAIFYPFTDEKFALHLMHSFDLGLFLVCLTGVILLIFFKDYRRDIARGFMVLFTIYTLAVASFSLKARFAAQDYAKALNLEVEKIYTLAQPLSVFNWRVMIFTKDSKIHDSFITLRKEQLQFENDQRTARVAKLYKPAKKAVWRIYRKVNPYYEKQYAAVQKHYGNNKIIQHTLKFSILKDSVNYKQYRCLRFKDLRTEGVRKSLKGYTLFCQNPKTKDVRVFAGDSNEEYQDISDLF